MNKRTASVDALVRVEPGDVVAFRWRAPDGNLVLQVGRLIQRVTRHGGKPGAAVRHLQRTKKDPDGWRVALNKWVDRIVPLEDFVEVRAEDVARVIELEANWPPPETRAQIAARGGSKS